MQARRKIGLTGADVPIPQTDARSPRSQGIALFTFPQLGFCGLQLGDIPNGADEARRSTLLVAHRLGALINGADLAVGPNNPDTRSRIARLAQERRHRPRQRVRDRRGECAGDFPRVQLPTWD